MRFASNFQRPTPYLHHLIRLLWVHLRQQFPSTLQFEVYLLRFPLGKWPFASVYWPSILDPGQPLGLDSPASFDVAVNQHPLHHVRRPFEKYGYTKKFKYICTREIEKIITSIKYVNVKMFRCLKDFSIVTADAFSFVSFVSFNDKKYHRVRWF